MLAQHNDVSTSKFMNYDAMIILNLILCWVVILSKR